MNKTTDKIEERDNTIIDAMFNVGAHFGRSKSRRHPTTKDFIFGIKNKVEIIDLEKTAKSLEDAKNFIESIIIGGKQVLFVGTKPEAKKIVSDLAISVGAPYVFERWIGGTLTNFSEIKKRVARLNSLSGDKETGELEKYTKKEQLMIDRDIEKLTKNFGGITSMKTLPGALFVVDSKHEKTAIMEAISMSIPIVAVASSDCDISKIDYPVVANDSSQASIKYFVEEMINAYKKGQANKQLPMDDKEDKKREVNEKSKEEN